MKIRNPFIILGMSLLSGLILLSGCDNTGNKTFQQTKGVDHYSFERPASYKQTVNLANSSLLSDNGVRFVGKLSDGSEIDLTVNIGAKHAGQPNAEAAANSVLSVEGRQLIDRSLGVIHTSPLLNVLSVSCQVLSLYTENFGSNNTSKFQKIAFFDYNDRIWDISVYSERGDAAQVNAVFDILLTSFTLLP